MRKTLRFNIRRIFSNYDLKTEKVLGAVFLGNSKNIKRVLG